MTKRNASWDNFPYMYLPWLNRINPGSKTFSPEFHFNLSQKQLSRQAINKRRKPKVTPARLHHSKLSLKLHALQKRNTYLQSQSSHSSSAPVLPRETTAVTIKQLRKDPTLSAHFSEEIE